MPSRRGTDPALAHEGRPLKSYFMRDMPCETELFKIERVENLKAFQKYKLHQCTRSKSLKTAATMHRSWSFGFGMEAITTEVECETGFDLAHANMKDNVYGVGQYFAFDPRLARFFFERKTASLRNFRCVCCVLTVHSSAHQASTFG